MQDFHEFTPRVRTSFGEIAGEGSFMCKGGKSQPFAIMKRRGNYINGQGRNTLVLKSFWGVYFEIKEKFNREVISNRPS